MLSKLVDFFPNSITTNLPPESTSNQYYWFKEPGNEGSWVGVPKADIIPGQLELLSSLFEQIFPDDSIFLAGAAKQWHSFLFESSDPPSFSAAGIRFIQFQINKADIDNKELEAALKEFFHNSPAFIWLDQSNGIIVDERTDVDYEEDDFQSIATTIESDFFTKTFFYIGKFRTQPSEIRSSFFYERDLFIEAMRLISRERAFTFEKVFPSILAAHLPETPGLLLEMDVVRIFREDHELMETMKVFLENNSNTSLAAKKLYVHRNTLQYRLEKFTEKTGMNLKDFNSALTVYLACLLAETSE